MQRSRIWISLLLLTTIPPRVWIVYSTMERPEVPILIFGNEISTSDGHLIALGIKEAPHLV